MPWPGTGTRGVERRDAAGRWHRLLTAAFGDLAGQRAIRRRGASTTVWVSRRLRTCTPSLATVMASSWRGARCRCAFETLRLWLQGDHAGRRRFPAWLMNEPGYLNNYRRPRRAHARRRGAPHRRALSLQLRGRGLGPVVRRTPGRANAWVCGLVGAMGLNIPTSASAFLARHGGQGFAIESAQAVLGFARDTLALPRLLIWWHRGTSGRCVCCCWSFGPARDRTASGYWRHA